MITDFLLTAALFAQDPVEPPAPPPEPAVDASEAACLRVAALEDPRIGPALSFSDALEVDARVVDGQSPGEPESRVRLLCLYHRPTGQAEIRAFDPDQPLAHSRQVSEVWWRAVEMSGAPITGTELVTLTLGGDGRIAGHSGCNVYSALYRIDGEAIEVAWPMTGTRRACVPAIMDQELRFRNIVLRAVRLAMQDDGTLLLTDRDGATIRFVRGEARMRPGG